MFRPALWTLVIIDILAKVSLTYVLQRLWDNSFELVRHLPNESVRSDVEFGVLLG